MVTASSIVENIIIVIISVPWILTRISHLILSVAIRSGEATPHLEMAKLGLEKLSYPESLPISRGAEIWTKVCRTSLLQCAVDCVSSSASGEDGIWLNTWLVLVFKQQAVIEHLLWEDPFPRGGDPRVNEIARLADGRASPRHNMTQVVRAAVGFWTGYSAHMAGAPAHGLGVCRGFVEDEDLWELNGLDDGELHVR